MFLLPNFLQKALPMQSGSHPISAAQDAATTAPIFSAVATPKRGETGTAGQSHTLTPPENWILRIFLRHDPSGRERSRIFTKNNI
jgi:hypothetical protein